jgi:hypothetical protein
MFFASFSSFIFLFIFHFSLASRHKIIHAEQLVNLTYHCIVEHIPNLLSPPTITVTYRILSRHPTLSFIIFTACPHQNLNYTFSPDTHVFLGATKDFHMPARKGVYVIVNDVHTISQIQISFQHPRHLPDHTYCAQHQEWFAVSGTLFYENFIPLAGITC